VVWCALHLSTALLIQRVMEAPPNKTHLPIYTYDFTFARYSILRLYPPRSLWQARLKLRIQPLPVSLA
jgi:hypothetical protein